MKIGLVFPKYSHLHRRFEEDIDVVGREFGLLPPLGLAYAAAIMEKAGHEVIIIDANALDLSKEKTLERLKDFNPDLLGFMLTVWTFQLTLEWIRYLKSAMGLPVLAGNIQLELYPEETFAHREIDYGIIGSAQKALPELLRALENKKDLNGIKGLVFRQSDRITVNYPDSFKEDFTTLPFPSRHLLPNHKYREVMSKKKNFTIMITSKGCPSQCNFCHIKGTPYSARGPERVVDEIEECYNKYGVREIDIFDPSFTIDKQRAMAICGEIVKRKINIYLSCRGRVDQIDEELLEEMSKAGFKRILYGIESGDQGILNNINKGITLADVRRAIKLTKKHNIEALGFFLIGSPGDTISTVEKTIRFAKELNLDYAQFHKVMAKPCTDIYDRLKAETKRDYWKEFVLEKAGEERLSSPWTMLTQKEIERFTIKAYHAFYFRPAYLLKALINVKSTGEFIRYFRSAIGLLKVKSDVREGDGR